MKKFLVSLTVVSLLLGCKTEKKERSTIEAPELSILEKVANAHGYQNWRNVDEIAFTFNVDRDSTHFERSWIWRPKSNYVTYISLTDSLKYNRKEMDSLALKTNAGFINDRYWLLAPFNLIWDKDNFTYTHETEVTAPISEKSMQKLTIVYGNEGGYTPGDAYDFFFDDNHIIQEWIFRKANQPEPSMATTWENYSEIEGLKLVKDHKKKEGGFNLYIDNISVTVDSD